MSNLSPPSLKELQATFKQHLMQDDGAIARHVVGTETLSNELRLSIYSHAYRARLEEALATDYDMLRKLVGENAFSTACQDYIDAFPSTYTSLRWFGQHFAKLLAYDAEQGSHDWFAEMAQLEWSFTMAFDAADAESVMEADVAAIPIDAWPSLVIEFHPSVRLMPIWWNTLGRWRAAKNDESVAEPQRLSESADCLLWREQLTTRYRSLASGEAVALRAALAGKEFSDICGALAEQLRDQESVPMKTAGYLKTWLAAGMVVGFEVLS